jgi:hypothetical protein
MQCDGMRANANITVKYILAGNTFDITSGQPYTEGVSLVGVNTGINPAEDDVGHTIPNGAISFSVVGFPDATPIQRMRSRTTAKSDLMKRSVMLIIAVTLAGAWPSRRCTRELTRKRRA